VIKHVVSDSGTPPCTRWPTAIYGGYYCARSTCTWRRPWIAYSLGGVTMSRCGSFVACDYCPSM